MKTLSAIFLSAALGSSLPISQAVSAPPEKGGHHHHHSGKASSHHNKYDRGRHFHGGYHTGRNIGYGNRYYYTDHRYYNNRHHNRYTSSYRYYDDDYILPLLGASVFYGAISSRPGYYSANCEVHHRGLWWTGSIGDDGLCYVNMGGNWVTFKQYR